MRIVDIDREIVRIRDFFHTSWNILEVLDRLLDLWDLHLLRDEDADRSEDIRDIKFSKKFRMDMKEL